MKIRQLITSLLFLGIFGAASLSQAATFTVTRFDDPAPPLVPPFCDAGDCSLREAVLAANVSGDPANEIILPAGDYALTITGDDEDLGFTGDLDVLTHDLTVNGAGANETTIDASALNDRIFQVPSSEAGNDIDFVINGVTLTGGNPSAATDNDGGAIFFSGTSGTDSLTLNNVVISGNQAVDGGGLSVAGDLTINASTISDNVSSGVGGGISSGAGLFKLNNSTISGNDAGGAGGGVNFGLMTLTARSSTIYDNNSASSGGGINFGLATFNVSNTILAGNTAPSDADCGGGGFATFTTVGYNIFGDVATCPVTPDPTDQSVLVAADLKLAALANYGGPTPTHAAASDSPAIDGGNPTDCLDADGIALTTDQRGQAREADGDNDGSTICDVGAFELGLSNLTLTKTADDDSIKVGNELTYTLVVTNEGPNTNFNIALTDTLPTNVSFVSATSDDAEDSCAHAAGVVSCELGQMDQGGTDTVTIVVTVDSETADGTMTNMASVMGTENDPDPADGTAVLVTGIDGGGCGIARGERSFSGALLAFLIGSMGAMALVRTRALIK